MTEFRQSPEGVVAEHNPRSYGGVSRPWIVISIPAGHRAHWLTQPLAQQEVATWSVLRTGTSVAEELRQLAALLRSRGHQREEIGSDDSAPCDGECEASDCHAIAAVSTWFRAAGLIDARADELAPHPEGTPA